MGGTLPVLSRFLVERREALGNNVGTLYALNTLGAVAGCFAAGFVLIGTVGVVETVYIAAVINLLVAAGTLLLDAVIARSGREAQPAAPKQERRSGVSGMALLILAAFGVSGFVSLGYEVIWARLLVFFVGNSTYAFSAMLSTFLLGLALGSFVAGKLVDRHGDPVGAFAVMEILIGLSAVTGLLVLRGTLEAEGPWVMGEQAAAGWLGDVGKMFEASFAVMFVPTLLMGATFPLAGKAYVRSVREVGQDIGAVYSVNTLGAILGAFVAGFALLSWLGIQGAIVFLAAINALVGLFVLSVHRGSANRLRFFAGPALAAAVLVAASCLPSGFVLRSDFEESRDTVLFYREDRAGTTKVFRKPDGHLLISVDGNTIGDTRDDLDAKQRLLAHLPLLLVPEPRSALVIGLGSGITAGAMTAYEEVERIDAVEIVPGVVEGALYFAKHNRRALKQPRLDVVVADGINYLMTSERRYDVISSDAKLNPGYTGNAVFLSSDYYRLCLKQLTDRGMMVQWIPLHLPQDSYRMVLRTFAEVFPHGSVWFFPGRHTLLVGTRKQLEIDMDRLLNRLRRPGVGDDLARFGLAHPWALLNGYRGALADIRQFAGSGPLSSWNHPMSNMTCTRWNAVAERMQHTFGRQALPMVWDFAEVVITAEAPGNWKSGFALIADVIDSSVNREPGQVQTADATNYPLPNQTTGVWFTDPPYYDAIPYSDLSDFFLVWFKRVLPENPLLRDPFDPDNPLSPKTAEAVQDETKQANGRQKDREWFEETMAKAFAEGRRILNEDGVSSVVFAHKTTEGWEALLSGMIRGGWTITGSWPIATEMASRLRARDSAALATSIHLICRPRPENAPIGDWADVLRELPIRVADWIERLQGEGIRGADLVFACIGPALEIFSRYRAVETAEGDTIGLPDYLEKVWEVVGRAALQQVLGTAEAQARNGLSGALEEDARLTALFLWTFQSTTPVSENQEQDEEADEEAVARAAATGFSLPFDVVRRFAQPMGIDLDTWTDRIIGQEKGVVRLLPVVERAGELFGEEGAADIAWLEESAAGTDPLQRQLFSDEAEEAALTVRERRPEYRAGEGGHGDTTLDRVHQAMLLQSSGHANALRTLIGAEQERGPEFVRLANALSALYPQGCNEKRLLDAMLLAMPR